MTGHAHAPTGVTVVACPKCLESGSSVPATTGSPVAALVGAPNSGKSTLFNALTGARRSVGNWSGTTVEVGEGSWRPAGPPSGREIRLVDLPGAYSLDPLSPDEALTRRLLVEVPAEDRPDVVVAVVDAAHLARSLYLVAQLLEQPLRVVVVLTMTDLAARRGVHVDADALSEFLTVPVAVVDPRRNAGTASLGAAVEAALATAARARRTAVIDGDDLAVADDRFTWAATAVEHATERTTDGSPDGSPDGPTGRPGPARATWTDRIDRWATAPVVGPLLFLATMYLVFQATTTIAAPLQSALSGLFSGPVADAVTTVLGAVGLAGSPLHGFVVDGLIAGVGMLLTFLPVMTLMFVLLSLLEDSGYMARAAVVTDRLMRRIGLPGRAFLPLVVGFGCNVPAIAATRALPNARHRVLTALLVPFTSCSARLTVYVLLATTFFPDRSGLVVFGMYLVSIALVVLVGLGLRSTVWRTLGGEPLLIDLPPYQRPTLRVVGLVSWVRVKGFLRTAGGIIVTAVTVVWLLQSIPVRGDAGFAQVPPSDSLYAAAAQAVSPVFEPAGFGEWQTTGALMVGFVAKEAVVSSWAQTYATGQPAGVAQPAGSSQPVSLATELRGSFARSSGGHPAPAALAFLVFVLAYTPCVATLAAQTREIGPRLTTLGVGLQLTVAWLLAVAVFQVGSLLS